MTSGSLHQARCERLLEQCDFDALRVLENVYQCRVLQMLTCEFILPLLSIYDG